MYPLNLRATRSGEHETIGELWSPARRSRFTLPVALTHCTITLANNSKGLLELTSGADVNNLLEIYWTLKKGRHADQTSAFRVETINLDTVFGTLTRTLDFTWASRSRLRVAE